MVEDKNRKELELGDEVVVHFRVSDVFEDVGRLNLVSIHNRHGVIPANDGDPNFVDEPAIQLTSTLPFRLILQRKARHFVTKEV